MRFALLFRCVNDFIMGLVGDVLLLKLSSKA